MNLPILFCPTHGNQGHRTVCKWCSHSLIPPLGLTARLAPQLPGGAFFTK